MLTASPPPPPPPPPPHSCRLCVDLQKVYYSSHVSVICIFSFSFFALPPPPTPTLTPITLPHGNFDSQEIAERNFSVVWFQCCVFKNLYVYYECVCRNFSCHLFCSALCKHTHVCANTYARTHTHTHLCRPSWYMLYIICNLAVGEIHIIKHHSGSWKKTHDAFWVMMSSDL